MGTLAIAMLTLGAQPVAQGPRPLTLISLAEIPRVQDVQLSPDGRSVSYMLARADWKTNRARHPHLATAGGGGPPTQLTSGEAGELLRALVARQPHASLSEPRSNLVDSR